MGAINEGVYDWNVVDDTIHYSESAQKAVGLPPELLRTTADWRSRIHPEDLPRYLAAIVDLLKGNITRLEFDYRYRGLDGSWQWARQHGVALRGRDGRVLRVVGATGDITGLKRAEEAARRSEERYALATSVAVEGIYEWEVDSGSLFLTERAKEVFALPGEQLTTANWNRRIHPDDFPGYRRAIVEHFKGRTPQIEHEYRITDGEGGYRWVRERGIGVRNAAGRVVKVVGALIDIARRKRAELEQTAIAEVLRVMAESMDLVPVFQAILKSASQLCEASFAAVFTYDGEVLRNVAHLNASPAFAEALGRTRPRPSRETTTRLCALERRTVHTADLLKDPRFVPPEAQQRENVRTALSVPMLREGVLLGVVTLWRAEVRPFTDHQIALVQTFADQAVIAIENVRLFDETRGALEQQRAIAEVLGVVTQLQTDVQPVFEAIGRNAARLCGALFSCVYRFDGELIHLVATHNLPAAATAVGRTLYPMRPDRSQLSGRAVLTGSVQRLEDATQDAEYAMHVAVAGGWRRLLAVPMLHEAGALGVIAVGWRDPGPIPEPRVELLKTFADQAVIAIEKVRLFNETREALEQQTATAEILEVTARSPNDVQPVFDAIARNAMRLCDGAQCALFRFDGRLQHFAAHAGMDAETIELLRQRYPRAPDPARVSGRSLLEREVIHLGDALADERFPGSAESFTTAGNRAVLSVPMLKAGAPIGVIFVTRPEPRRFSDRQVALLRTFADQAVIAIENVRLFNETREALEQQQALAEVLGAMSSSLAETQPVFDRILDNCERLFEGHLVGMTLLGDDGQIRLGAYKGGNKAQMEAVYPYPLGRDSGSGQAILERRVVRFTDVGAPGSDAPPQVIRGSQAVGFKSIIFAPLLDEGRAIGALWVGRRLPGPFDDRQATLLKTFADQAVIAIRNARLFNETLQKSRQLEIASRHKSEFLANMSHELRTPLNAIIGFTRIVMRRSKEALEPQQYENLEKILTSGHNLLALINSVLDLSKVEAGRVELRPGEVEVAPVLEQCLRTVEPLVRVALVKEFDGGLPSMYVDEEKLRQIVINLLSNAAKFTEQGTIRLRAQAANGSMAITVADTGIGIAADKLELIFAEFEQAHAGGGGVDGRPYGGTGLGLAIARRLARLMGGDIGVESALGSGSRFTLTLPLRYAS
jgi:two-component system, NtrC family, sensor kinase